MQQPNANFFDIQREFNEYWKDREQKKGDGWKAFKRWEYFWESRINPDGSFPDGKELVKALDAKNLARREAARAKGARTQSASANFSLMGPNTAIPTNGGSGRLNTVCFHPTNSNIIFVGSPAGGLWKSTNNGAGWTSNTDQFTTLGVSAIAIDPQNPNTMFIGTGDRDASDTYGTGIYKSTDGGSSWSTTGFSNSIQGFVIVSRVLVHPTQSNIIIAATSNGIHKSTNGGTSWTQKSTGSMKELYFMPDNPAYLYATNGGNILRSTNTGETWTTLSPGFAASSVNRIALAVCPQNPRLVYALCSNGSNSTFYGLYRSLDSGNTWSLRASTPNILGGASDGSDSRGQGWYDLCIAVNPNDSNDVFVGGINTWRSTTGGSTWSCKSMWYTGTSLPYVHADEHEMAYKPGTSELYVCSDGGLFRTTNFGTNWTDLSAGLQIMQFYRISNSSSSATRLLGGAQDNGTNFMNTSTWAQIYGGDGMDNATDQSNHAILYASSQNGNFGRSTNSGTSFSTITPSGKGSTGAWVTPIVLDASNNVYLAYTNVYKSTNQGSAWSTLGTSGLSSNATYLDVSRSDANSIVIGNSSQLFRTTNSGTTWTSIKGSLPNSLSRVIIHPQGPDTLIACVSSWTSGSKVFKSTNGGTSWTNISGSLPNVPINCALYEGNSNNGLYIGTDIGIYYRNNLMSDWITFDDGLPNVRVNDLDIYAPTAKLRAGTYGRGAWQGDLYNDGPHAQFSASRVSVCANDTLTLRDNSTNGATSRFWSMPGATPASSTDVNPVVSYASAGQYPVTLVVSNSYGTDSLTITNFITIKAVPLATVTASKNVACTGDSIVLSGPPSMSSYRWSTNDTTRTIVFKTVGSFQAQLTVVDPNGCSASSPMSSYTIYASPTTTISGDTVVCVQSEGSYRISATTPGSVYRWFKPSNGTIVGDSSAGSISIRWTGVAKDTVHMSETNVRGCTIDRFLVVNVGAVPTAGVAGPSELCQSRTQIFSASSLSSGASVEWQQPKLGSIIGSNSNPSGVTIHWNTTGSDSVVVKVSNSFGCTSMSSLKVNVKSSPQPSVNGPTRLCHQSEQLFSCTENAGSNYQWIIPSSAVVVGDTGKSTIRLRFNSSGNDSVRVIETSSNGCTKEVSLGINVEPIPNPSISGVDAACVGYNASYSVPKVGANSYAWNRPRLGSVSDTTSHSLQVLWTRSGVDTLVLRETSSLGCSSSTQYIVRISDQLHPSLSSSTGSQFFCRGEKITLSTSSGYTSYQWRRNGTPIGSNSQSLEVSEDGAYTVLVNSGTCSGVSDTLHISQHSQPAQPTLIIVGNTLRCNVPASRYEWYADNVVINGATSSEYTAQNSGRYCVRLIDTNGCKSELECSPIVVTVESNDASIASVQIEPNPVEEFFSVRSTVEFSRSALVVLRDETGREVFSREFHSPTALRAYRFDLGHIAAGAYFVHICFDNTRVDVRKLLRR